MLIYMKKHKIILTTLAIAGTIIFLQSFTPPNNGYDVAPGVKTFEQSPPAVKSIWVKQIAPLVSGVNMMMKLELDETVCFEPITGHKVDIYRGDGSQQKITFYDDGGNGDEVPGDGFYTAYLTEDIHAFKAEMSGHNNRLAQQGGTFIDFIGHTGVVTAGELFSISSFDMLDHWTKMPDKAMLSCDVLIDKPRSLFITDSSVVEDPARTFNVAANEGNPEGAWTFSTLVKNMTGIPASPIPAIAHLRNESAKALLKSWVERLMNNQTIGGQFVRRRSDVLNRLLVPWLQKADPSNPGLTRLTWEEAWDRTSAEAILYWAPFKLTAIVNRLDLRANIAYKNTVSNAGETRFIYTYIGYDGNVVIQPNQDGAAADYLDWKGLNIILEYGNVQTTSCDLVTFARDWAELSNLELGSSAYLEKLESITNTVTAANAAPAKVNGSALNRMRTNEKIFYDPNIDHTSGSVGFAEGRADSGHTERSRNEGWFDADWEFRQFELSASTNVFEQVFLTNTPLESANVAFNVMSREFRMGYPKDGTSPWYNCYMLAYGGIQKTIGSTDVFSFYGIIPAPYAGMDHLINWINAPFPRGTILRGNFNIPTTYGGSGSYLLAAAGRVRGEYVHYWDLDWFTNPATISTPKPSLENEQIRHLISLNTCQGCHNGETKTMFTHVMPLNQGQGSRYWPSIPDAVTGEIDTRVDGSVNSIYVPQNMGKTSTGSGLVSNYSNPTGARYYQTVSAFLTGRNYTGPVSSPGFTDDDDDAGENSTDNNMDGLFYVNDPSNDAATPSGSDRRSIGADDNKYGYNDLRRRQEDLCRFINSGCGIKATELATKVTHVPLPLGSH